ncbi:MAG TPA: type IV secretion system DNA-binding domain-containing protein [Candidatus Saccharimonadales bacterium]|nr:type IV secretion system DNA-binding domain-containing protein [Candidatus Saccharimonadales bacterium]
MEYILRIGSSETMITYVVIGIAMLAAVLLFMIYIRFIDLKRVYQQKTVFIEVTPPYEASKTPEAMEQLFHILHGAGATQKLKQKLLRRSNIFSLEVTSTRHEGVRYVIGTSEREADSIERSIAAFLSDSRVKRIDDPLLRKNAFTKVKEFKQTKHFALPIRTQATFEQHDPIAYVTGAMNRLSDDEQVTLQLVISPARIRNMAAIVDRYHEFYKVSDATHNKGYGHLFRSELRVRVVATSSKRKDERLHGIESAIASFSIPKVQTLKARYNFPQALRGRYREWAFAHRMPSLIPRNSNIFSSLELANLYHFPASQTSTENLVVSLSRSLAPPLSIINNTDYDVVLGRNFHRGVYIDIGLTAKEREKHVYIIGGTGNGKTTLLEYGIVQDIQNGKGVAIVDPHGDLAESLLNSIPEEREKDVIYFNPDDLSYPIGLNLLELTPGLDEEDALRERDLVTESVISIFRKIFSDDDNGGHRIEYVLRSAVHTALTVEDATLFTIYDLLNDPDYRYKVVGKLENKDLKNFWINEMGKAGGMQQVKMVAGITAKIGRFLFSASAKRVLEQPKSTINFDDILNGKILICNFSKGLIGEDTSELFGIAVLAKLQLASLRRARLPQKQRIPFYLYVDEFQNFATVSFVQMLSESRKYKLFLVMAEQSTSQQDDQNMVNIILANVGTVICFRTGNPADEKLILPLFSPYLEEGGISNLPPYNFYMRISATKPQEPFSGETLLLDDAGSEEMAERVIGFSKLQYARKYIPPMMETEKENPKQSSESRVTKQAVQKKDKLKTHRKKSIT